MVDEVGITSGGLTDRLGRHGIVSSNLSIDIIEGRLELRSTGASLRVGFIRIPLRAISPRITLLERTAGDAQHVSLRLDAPILGRLYEYEGTFTYAIETQEHTNG